ncbi:MAG: hypothetical protein WB810_11295 [Candidatus Cybelea sp.]
MAKVKAPSRKLKGTRLKIDRANKHIADFKEVVTQFLWFTPNLYGPQPKTRKNRNPKHLKDVFRLKVALPNELFTTAGDAIHNLRSALDHVAFAIAIKAGVKSARALRDIDFPIRRNRKTFNDSLNKAAVKQCGAKALAFYRCLKPYNRGNKRLWALQDLDVVDKHRKLLVLIPRAGVVRIIPGGGSPPIDLATAVSLKKGIKTSAIAAAHGYPNAKTQLAPLIAFDHVGFRSTDAVEVLEKLSTYVTAIIEEASVATQNVPPVAG